MTKQIHSGIAAGQVSEGYKLEHGYVIPKEWKVVHFNECFHRLTQKNTENNQNVLTISAQQGLISQLDYYNTLYASEDKTGYFLLQKGDFAYNKSYSADYAYGAIKQLEKYDKGIVSPLYICFSANEGTNTDFYRQYFEAGMFNREIYKVAQEGARNHGLLNVSTPEFFSAALVFPPVDEQKKIAEVLLCCDRVIDLKQQLIIELQQLKNGFLQAVFPTKGCNKPDIRFPGFSEAWEQRKAVDLAEYSKGNGYSKGDLTDVGTPIILYGRLYTKYQFAINEVDTFAVPRSGAVYSQGNEVIVPASGETAEDIARASAVEKSGVLLGGDLNILRPFDFINPLFLALAISNGGPQNELAKKAQGKSVVHIHNSDIQEVTIAYPSRTEQDRIVSVFRNLDHLITLHQRELEETKKKKRGLAKLLLTGGVRVPT